MRVTSVRKGWTVSSKPIPGNALMCDHGCLRFGRLIATKSGWTGEPVTEAHLGGAGNDQALGRATIM